MSAEHPRPWRAVPDAVVRESRRDGRRGTVPVEYWAVLDARGVYIAQGLDENTALEIADETADAPDGPTDRQTDRQTDPPTF